MKLSEIREACEKAAADNQSHNARDPGTFLTLARTALPALLEAVDRYFHGDEDFDEALLHAGIEVDE